MVSLAGALASLVIVQAWGDAVEGRSARASWLSSAKLLGSVAVITGVTIAAGRLLA